MSSRNSSAALAPGAKRTWEAPRLTRHGNVADVLQFPGEGKISMVADDMGDAPRKPKGQEMD
jgi:hypothetical protein